MANYDASSKSSKVMRKRAGEWLAGLRTAAGLTQREVAERANWDYYTFVSQIERGISRVSPDDMPLLAELYQQDQAEFAKRCLYYYEPWMHFALFGGKHPYDIERLPRERSINANERRRPAPRQAAASSKSRST